MEDDLKKNGRRPQKNQIKDDLKKRKKEKGRRPKKKWKTNQSTKIDLIGCDTIVNSPSNNNNGLFCQVIWYTEDRTNKHHCNVQHPNF